jgi:choline dehydrogenase-like flavoprotein
MLGVPHRLHASDINDPDGNDRDPHTVVDSHGAVWGVDGVHVDASIMLDIVSAPTDVTNC